ncbi:hypothetical protein HDU80_001790, partial [Chytriomyces hyalinus]
MVFQDCFAVLFAVCQRVIEQCAKTGAYPDIPLISTDHVAIVEVDENQHQFYDKTCELARYDTLQFGTAVLLPTRVRNYLNEELEVDAAPVASVEWLFYGQHASATLRILPDVNDLNIALDKDIAAFSLSDLGSLEAVVNAAVVEKISEIGGHEQQCHAINHANNPLKRKRCSVASMKNSNISLRGFCKSSPPTVEVAVAAAVPGLISWVSVALAAPSSLRLPGTVATKLSAAQAGVNPNSATGKCQKGSVSDEAHLSKQTSVKASGPCPVRRPIKGSLDVQAVAKPKRVPSTLFSNPKLHKLLRNPGSRNEIKTSGALMYKQRPI